MNLLFVEELGSLEEHTLELIEQIKKNYAGASNMTPWLWFNNGWDACRKAIKSPKE
jgi:hypothetical protein